ncbi:unnamed protein product, partial [marine sediment metagenome]
SDEMQKQKSLVFVDRQGLEGDQGETGEDGEDELNTGPMGIKGEQGLNAAFPGTLAFNGANFDTINADKAIVKIDAEESEEGNFLILTRANLGNPLATPNTIQPSDIFSPWLVVPSLKEEDIISRKSILSSDCKFGCGVGTSSIYYTDITTLLDTIEGRFDELVLELKAEKEKLVKYWLRVMRTVFAVQKDAICCALENCKKRTKNEFDRRFFEGIRIQAANSD